MRCSFRGRRSTLDFRRVALRIFLWIALSGLRQVVTRCKFRGKHCILWDGMKIDGSLAGSQFRGHRKLVGKRGFWSYKVRNFEEASRKMLLLMLPHVSSRVSGFPVASPCLWEKLQNFSFSKVSQQVVMLRGRSGTSWHSNVSGNASKFIWCGRRNTLASFSDESQ